MLFGDAIETDGPSLTITRVTSLDEWTDAVALVAQLEACTPWWLGDLLNIGEHQFGELYAQGIPEGLSLDTLKVYQWVAERIPPENRCSGLSWSHHRAVAAMEASEQAELLGQAEDEGLSVRELTRRSKGQEAESPGKTPEFHVKVQYCDGSCVVIDADDCEQIAMLLGEHKRVLLIGEGTWTKP